MNAKYDYSLMLVTDRGLSRGRDTLSIVKAAVAGGVTCVQVREKDADTRTFVNEALAIRNFLKEKGVPLFINDRIDVALAVEADGVHLGQSDMPLETARRILGPDVRIGISAESVEEGMAARKGGADYVSVSPVFHTDTKADIKTPKDLAGVRAFRETVGGTLMGIGGIHAGNAGQVIEHGLDGVAVVSAIVAADDPEKAAARIMEAIQKARE